MTENDPWKKKMSLIRILLHERFCNHIKKKKKKKKEKEKENCTLRKLAHAIYRDFFQLKKTKNFLCLLEALFFPNVST